MTELQIYLPGVLLSLSAVMLALMSPGPNILAVIGTSMGVGDAKALHWHWVWVAVRFSGFQWLYLVLLH